ncbi:hypothetical protein PLICRDRAFT_40070 [Plicaturopsis crispa FD-325 SS-3]|nr:hypothetical protein PLICRDRAFT_40070 [Plicaturopsis crispa FD-325 SS-3]
MSSTIDIFLTGATGYIGGTVLTRLLQHPKAAQFRIRALIRNKDKAALIASKYPSVTPIIGANQDLQLLEDAAASADIIVSAADSDDLPAAEAIVRGLKRRHQETGKVPVIIHTSGTGVLGDSSAGMYPTEDIYDDADAAQIATLPATQPHRRIDLAIEAADTAGYARSFIVLPSMIYGLATGPLVDIGFQNPHSVQIPGLIKASIQRGQGGVVGKGANFWHNVHIDEVADIYILILDAVLSGSNAAGHGQEGYYFGENGEHKMYDVSVAIAKALFELGKGESPEPTTFTEEDYIKHFAILNLSRNSRSRATRSKALGWKPTKTTDDLLASIKPEVEAILKSGNTSMHLYQ